MGNRANDLARWQERKQNRTETLAEMVARLGGQQIKLPAWLLPILVAELWGLRWDTFNGTYYLRQRVRARDRLTRLLAPSEQSAIATWHMYGDALDELESEPER